MEDFTGYFRALFADLDGPPGAGDGTSAADLDAAERRLGVRLPPVLRAYFLVAGKLQRFNRAYERLLTSSEWVLDRRKLVFAGDARGRERYAVPISGRLADPAVHSCRLQGSVLSLWQRTETRCRDFLTLTVCHHAAGGAMPFTGYAPVDRATGAALAGAMGPALRCRDRAAWRESGWAVCLIGPLRSDGMWYDVLIGGRSAREFGAAVKRVTATGVGRLETYAPYRAGPTE